MAACDALSAPCGNGGVEHIIGRSDQPSPPEFCRNNDTDTLQECPPLLLTRPAVLPSTQGHASERPEGNLGMHLIERRAGIGPTAVHLQDLLGQREGLLADPSTDQRTGSLAGLLIGGGLDNGPERGWEDARRSGSHNSAGLDVGSPGGCREPDRDIHGHDRRCWNSHQEVAEARRQYRSAEPPFVEHDAYPAGLAAINPYNFPVPLFTTDACETSWSCPGHSLSTPDLEDRDGFDAANREPDQRRVRIVVDAVRPSSIGSPGLRQTQSAEHPCSVET
jgi:hypothetical protein